MAALLGAAAPLPLLAREAPSVAVGPQYDTTHVYVAPSDVDAFVAAFTATFGGASTKQGIATVTPTPSSTSTQLVQTPVGTVSLFGFRTPIPWPFGAERTGWLVTDMDEAIRQARAAGADVIVSTFPDPIGRDAVIQWPGGVIMQLYWHNTKPSYALLATVPENRVYMSADKADEFVRHFSTFAHARLLSDERNAPGIEIGRPGHHFRRIRLESTFGKLTLLVTDGHLPWPYGREMTGYEVPDLDATLAKAKAAGVEILVPPFESAGRKSAMVSFPGGYVAEVHSGS
ncbi:glyoxalase [Sphingomonas oleivorans]|uniref:Glyoxalase n=1 Tax=Sphingomonas oleivorans TaxID=1735121 RepID=A0A2T5FTY3_9SPHN|nr:glyoxalase [Sphingomonas oleivorans]